MLFRHRIRSLACVMMLLVATVVAAQPAGPPPGGPPTDGPPPQEGRPPDPRGGAAGRPGGSGPLMERSTPTTTACSPPRRSAGRRALCALDRDRDGKIEGSELRARPAGRAVRNRPAGRAVGGPGEVGPPPEGPGGFGPPPGGPGGRGRGPEVGDVMPPFVRQQLRLEADQSRKIKELESDVRAKLNRILSRDQMHDFDRILREGPGGPRREGRPAVREDLWKTTARPCDPDGPTSPDRIGRSAPCVAGMPPSSTEPRNRRDR